MNRYVPMLLATTFLASLTAFSGWLFPGEDRPRISTLMKPVNELIDRAEDKKSEGLYSESVDLYREALAELQKVEYENPDRVSTPEFSTVKNKRAYINAAIATLQLREASEEDGLVTLSETTELEKRISEQQQAQRSTESKTVAPKPAEARKAPADRESRRCAAVAKVPADVGKLNRFAAKAMQRGDAQLAEAALRRAIELFPESHYAYFNLARLMLSLGVGNAEIRKVYEAGCSVGGPRDAEIEKALKGS